MSTKEQRDEWQRLSDENQLDEWTVTKQAGDEDDKEATIWAGEGHLCIGDFYHAADAKTAAMARNALPALLQDIERLALDFANCADVGRRLEAQLAAMTAERDASSEDPRAVAVIKDLNSQVVELKSERDAARFEAQDRTQRYLKTRDRQDALIVDVKKLTGECASARSERDASNIARELQWKELQAARAALGRAHAAISRWNAGDDAACDIDGALVECWLDPEGRAAAEYVARLEKALREISALDCSFEKYERVPAVEIAREALGMVEQ